MRRRRTRSYADMHMNKSAERAKLAVEALIALLGYADADVRDWEAHAFQTVESDSDEIRASFARPRSGLSWGRRRGRHCSTRRAWAQ